MLEQAREADRPARARCAVCHDERGDLIVCGGCGTWCHADCRAALASCPTLGCGAKSPVETSRPMSRERLWLMAFLVLVGFSILLVRRAVLLQPEDLERPLTFFTRWSGTVAFVVVSGLLQILALRTFRVPFGSPINVARRRTLSVACGAMGTLAWLLMIVVVASIGLKSGDPMSFLYAWAGGMFQSTLLFRAAARPPTPPAVRLRVDARKDEPSGP